MEYRAETAFLQCACEPCCKQDAGVEYRAETAFLQCACEPCCKQDAGVEYRAETAFCSVLASRADVEYRAETAYTKQIQGAMSYQKTAVGFSFAVLARVNTKISAIHTRYSRTNHGQDYFCC